MVLRETIQKIILEHFDDKIKDLIFDNIHVFGDKYRSYHGRIKNGLIVRFFLNEFLKYYGESKLKKIGDWDQFIKLIYRVWNKKKTTKQEIVFRGGGEADEMFFSNNIYVAAVFSNRLNAYVLNFKNPYILDCENSDWMNINEP